MIDHSNNVTDEVKEHIRQLLTAGTIRPQHSPWTTNVVMVKKKNGKLRMCVDYRQLKNNTLVIIDDLSGSSAI